MENLIRLAEIFDKFIEVGDSFVLADEIKAIRGGFLEGGGRVKGITIITPYGQFEDTSVDFETFKQRINDIKQAMNHVKPVSPKREKPEPSPDRVLRENEQSPKVRASKKKIPQTFTIPIEAGQSGNCEGTIPLDPGSKIVDRQDLVVTDPNGVVLGTGTIGGTIVGTIVSGIVFESGKYRLAFKGYQGSAAAVQCMIETR